MSAAAETCADHIRDIPDFPKPGIVFKDITPLFLDPAALRARDRRARPTYAREREARLRGGGGGARVRARRRGGGAQSGAGFIPARKPGQAAVRDDSVEYALEYGIDALEMHADALSRRRAGAGARRPARHGRHCARVCDLVEQAGGDVAGCAFIVELRSWAAASGWRRTTCTPWSCTTDE